MNVSEVSEKIKAALGKLHELMCYCCVCSFCSEFVSSSADLKTHHITVKLTKSSVRMLLQIMVKFEGKRLEYEFPSRHDILMSNCSCFFVANLLADRPSSKLVMSP